jgi:1-pyrroline-5-carboxylate dehydrogenase
MNNGIAKFPLPLNDPILSYAPGTPERAKLKARLDELYADVLEVPALIGGKEVRTGNVVELVAPQDRAHVLARYHACGEQETRQAIEAARKAWPEWNAMPWEQRAAVFMRAAELLAGPERATLVGATMLGQSKNVYQAEIDAACELIDFWRFNVWYAQEIYGDQPPVSPPGFWNYLEYRALEGFVLAVSPFNFTAIGGNLPSAPALMGNCVLWKPAEQQTYSAYYTMQILRDAGLPDGVINMLPGDGAVIGPQAMASPELSGVHFTGSTAVFKKIWHTIGTNIDSYHGYPRIVGETGGKDFVVAHSSADAQALAVGLARGAFEYQGQKCSAASRAYIPMSLWPRVREETYGMLDTMKMGDVRDFGNFINAVIDDRAFAKITDYVKQAKDGGSNDVAVEYGGEFSDKEGYFVKPTVVVTKDPQYRTMREEIFGPVLSVYVYPDNEWESTLELAAHTSPYGLTGAVFANERTALVEADKVLGHSAGNFYVNDKPTGAVVGQQPFGGGRASGTNDKAGSHLNLLRWVSPRTVKENFNPPRDYRYPFMAEGE